MTTGAISSAAAHGGSALNGHHHHHQDQVMSMKTCHAFQMPLHYPRYTKTDYEKMPESQLDRLLTEYGLPAAGNADWKRKFAIGAFLWPDQL